MMIIRFISLVFTACPDHCKQCTVNAANGAVECNTNMCDNGYGIKEADKTCLGIYSDLFS